MKVLMPLTGNDMEKDVDCTVVQSRKYEPIFKVTSLHLI